MKAKIENKDKTLFWLRRRLRALETSVDHEAMARSGMHYAARAQVEADVAKLVEANKAEVESLRAAILFIEENAE